MGRMSKVEDKVPYLVRVPGRDAWHIRHGKRRITTGEVKRGAASRALANYINEMDGKTTGSELETIGDVIDYWVEVKKPGMLANGMWNKKWKFVIATIRRHADDVLLSSAGFKWSRTYAAARRAEGVKGPTIRQELSTIRAAWKLSVDHEMLTLAPKAFDLPDASAPRERWLTREEAASLVEASIAPHIRLFIELALATAGRHGAILELQWHQIHFDKAQIDLRVSPDEDEDVKVKRKKRAMVPVSDRIMEILKEARERTAGDHVIEYHGKPLKSVWKGVKSTAERAGLSNDVTPHILRHTAATWMCQAGVDLWQVAGFMGHSSTKQVELTYGHHCPDHMVEAREALT